MLAHHFAIRDGHLLGLDLALQAPRLFNDFHFRRKADNLKEEMDRPGSVKEHDKLKVKYDAYAKNIQDNQEEALQPAD